MKNTPIKGPSGVFIPLRAAQNQPGSPIKAKNPRLLPIEKSNRPKRIPQPGSPIRYEVARQPASKDPPASASASDRGSNKSRKRRWS